MAIIDTEGEDYLLVLTAHRCSEGHVHSEVHAPAEMTAERTVELLGQLAHQILQKESDGQKGLVVVSPAEFRSKVEEAARRKATFGDAMNVFGPMARGAGPSRWS